MSEGRGTEVNARLRQLHHAYLDSEFVAEYYREVYDRDAKYTKHFDFGIGLGGAIGGGSGLGGTLAQMPELAWICGPVTVAAAVLAIAKANYDWPSRQRDALSRAEFASVLAAKYLMLIQDSSYMQEWTDDFEKKFLEIRQSALERINGNFPKLPLQITNKIQDKVLEQTDRSGWWRPYRNEAEGTSAPGAPSPEDGSQGERDDT